MDISKSIKFIDICKILEKIRNADGGPEKERCLKRYIESFNEFSKKFQESNGPDSKSSFYCVMRCLIPGADTARDSYGLKVTTIGRIYMKILQLPTDSVDAIKLQHRSRSGIRGDYADIVFSVIQSRVPHTPSDVSLFDIHSLLDNIAANDRRSVETELTKFLEVGSALEQKWLIRLLLKRMSLGIGEQRIFTTLHPNAKEFYTRCSDLERVCIAIQRGDELPLQEVVVPFQHIRPMLCDRLELGDLYEIMRDDNVYSETKMDGERFHIHLSDEVFKYISRNGRDYTAAFGSHHAEGNLTPVLVKLLKPHVKSMILDGEMMVWDKEDRSFKVKGENIDVKHLTRGGSLRPCFVVYDLLYLNGDSLLDVIYTERVDKLKTVLEETEGVLQIGKRTEVCTLQHFQEIFNAALDANEEGVVLKLRRSTYKPGSRKGGWYKVKADYIEGLTSDMDMVIMGGFYNRTRTYVNSYLLGVVQGEGDDVKLHCVGKVAIGLSKDERIHLNSQLLPKWKKGFPNARMHFGKVSLDVWIEPEDSIVLQVKASELGQASSFATPYVLRFPRIEAVRSDKSWRESMTLEEYEKFYKSDHGVKKIHKRDLQLDDLTTGKRVKLGSKASKTTATVYTNKFNRNEVTIESSIFDGFNFCIVSEIRGSYSAHKLKELVVKNGGNIVENPSPKDHMCICIAASITSRVTDLCKTGLYNVVSHNWLVDTAERKRMQLKPRDMLSSTNEMKEELKMRFDPYGDSYVDHVDEEELKILIEDLKNDESLPQLQMNEIASLEDDIYGLDGSPNFFRNIQAHFYKPDGDEWSDEVAMARLTFQWRGGICLKPTDSEIDKKTKYLFADPRTVDLPALEIWFLANFTSRLLKVKPVSIKWITDSFTEGRRLPVDSYLIKF